MPFDDCTCNEEEVRCLGMVLAYRVGLLLLKR